MKKLLVLVFALIAVLCLTFAVSAAADVRYTLDDIESIVAVNGTDENSVQMRADYVKYMVDNDTYSAGLWGNTNDWMGNVNDYILITFKEEMQVSSVYVYGVGNWTNSTTTGYDAEGNQVFSKGITLNDGAYGGQVECAIYNGEYKAVKQIKLVITAHKGTHTHRITEIKVTGHRCSYTYSSETKQPLTCTQDGIVWNYCECGKYVTTTTSCGDGEHSYDNGKVTLDPTLEADGERTFTCVECEEKGCTECEDYQYKTPISKLGHNWDDGTVTPPTCTEKGYTTYRCTGCSIENCNATKDEDYVDALSHNYVCEMTLKPTTTSTGINTFTCQNDATHTYTETIDMIPWSNHQVLITNDNVASIEEVLYAGITSTNKTGTLFDTNYTSGDYWSAYDPNNDFPKGNYVTIVFATEYRISEDVILYAWSNWNSLKIEFYNENNERTYIYENGAFQTNTQVTAEGVNLTGTTGKLVKKIVLTQVESKWKGDGLRIYGFEMYAHQHVNDGTKIDYVAPTCTTMGSYYEYCEDCGVSDIRVEIAALGHTPAGEGTVVDPTCTTDGYTSHECSVCGETYTENHIAYLGHTWTEVERVEPNCTEDGKISYVCNACDTGATKEDSIKATGHTEVVDAAVDATCTATGLTEGKHCEVCGEVIVAQETVDALGHTPSEDGTTCTVCNAALAVAKIGDTLYATLEEAFANANAGDTITLVGNIELVGAGIVVNKAVTLNLNGFDIAVPNDTYGDGVFCVVENGELTINGEGTVNAFGPNPYCMAIWAKGGNVVINGGTYTNIGARSEIDGEHFDLIYVSMGGNVVINGGTFICETPEWTINYKNSAPGTCAVYGGTFVGFNPNANKDGEDFIPAGYVATATDNIYTVAACTAHAYDNCARNEEDTGYIYTCTLCGTSYTTYTKGTTQEPIEAVIGENTVTIYNTDAGEIYYYLPVDGYGKYTIKVDASVGFKYDASTKTIGRQQFTFGQTTYEFVVDSDDFNEIVLAFTSNVETFTVAYEAMEYPTVVLGSNTITATGMGSKYVIDAYGNVIISIPEDSNAFVTVGDNSIEPGKSIEITIADGETVKIVVSTNDYSESAEVTIILHVHEYNRPVWDETTDATCTTEGKEVWACECGETEITYLPVNPNAHPFDNIENFKYVDSTCNEYGYEEFYCSACEQNIHIDYDYLGAHNFNDNGICEVCGKDAKGTAQAPIVVTIGENTFYVVEGADYTIYMIPVTYDLGKLTITIDANASVAFSTSPYNFETFETGNTSYEAIIDSNEIWGEEKYYAIAIANCETFTVAYTEEARPQLVPGANAIEVPSSGWGAAELVYVVNVPGSYVLSLAEGETNAWIVRDGEVIWLDEEPYSFTVAEGETVKFVITTGNWSADTIDLVLEKVVEHVHTEVEIPAVLPTPSKTGYTAGIKCAECGETIKAPVEITVTQMADTRDPNFRVYNATLSLQESISVVYRSVVGNGYNKPYMVFVFRGNEYIYTDYEIDPANGRYKFAFDAMLPQFMGENIEAYVFAETAEGQYSMNCVLEYSVQQYCTNQLKKGDAALTTLISDVLVYGSWVQKYVGYNTSNLIYDVVAKSYTLTPSMDLASVVIDKSVDVQAVTGDRTQGTDWYNAALVLGDTTIPKFRFVTNNIDDLIVKVEIAGEVFAIDEFEYEASTGRYIVQIDFVKSYQYNETITATFVRGGEIVDGVIVGGEQVGSTLTYSLNTYLYRNYEKASQTNNAKNLMRALYIYGESVYNYFKDILN